MPALKANGGRKPADMSRAGRAAHPIDTISASPLPATITSPTRLFISARATGDT
jgi:hypothetical protein